MRQIFTVFFLFLFTGIVKASVSTSGPEPLASTIMIPLLNTDYQISLSDFVKLTPREYEKVTGKQMGLKEKLLFKVVQHKIKKTIRKDGTVSTEKMKKQLGFFSRWSWHWGGFALGFLLILGPIIALFFKDDYKWDRFWTAMTTASALMAGLAFLISSGL